MRLTKELIRKVALFVVARLQLCQAIHVRHRLRSGLSIQHDSHRLGCSHSGATRLLGHAGINLFVGEFCACHVLGSVVLKCLRPLALTT